jgi:hypothetical protein
MKDQKCRISLIIVALLVFACTSCGKSKTDEQEYLIAQWLQKNPNDYVRKWESTYYIAGTVDAKKTGFVESGRIKAVMSCFNLIHTYQGDSNESELHICMYYSGPVGERVDRAFGSKEDLERLLRELDFQPS